MVVEFTFMGLLLTLIFTGITGIYPGGLIVPGYLALYINQPARLAGTLIAALLTVGLYKLASRYFILFGRRRLVFMLTAGGILVFLSNRIFPIFPIFGLEFRVIGWIIPGLIANHFERQGIIITSLSLTIVTISIYLVAHLIRLIFQDIFL